MTAKKMPTRRRRALRRTGAALLLLALTVLLNGWRLGPQLALRESEDLWGTGKTAIVRTFGRLPIGSRRGTVYLTANENAAILSELRFSLLSGWSVKAGCVLDCSDEKSRVHTALWTLNDGEESFGYFFGRVDDAEIREVSFLYGHQNADGKLTILPMNGDPPVSKRADWMKWEGHDYFVLPYRYDAKYTNEHPGWFYPCIDGELVSPEKRVDSWTGTSLGN